MDDHAIAAGISSGSIYEALEKVSGQTFTIKLVKGIVVEASK